MRSIYIPEITTVFIVPIIDADALHFVSVVILTGDPIYPEPVKFLSL